MLAKKLEQNDWLMSGIIGTIGAVTLFFVKVFLDYFLFHGRLDIGETLATAVIFGIVFTVVSRMKWGTKPSE